MCLRKKEYFLACFYILCAVFTDSQETDIRQGQMDLPNTKFNCVKNLIYFYDIYYKS